MAGFIFRSALLVFALLFISTALPAQEIILPPGHRPVPPGVHALVGGKVVVKPGEVLDPATIVIRDGFIEAVGKNVQPPADARVWELNGAVVYAGFIDPYLTLGSVRSSAAASSRASMELTSGINFFGTPGGETDPGNPGPGSEIALITPERRVAENYAPDAKLLEKLREIGFTAANVVPEKGILRGTSAFVVLSEENPNRAILKPDVFQHVVFDNEGGRENAYPSSLMGIVAAVRQAFFNAQHYVADYEHYRKNPAGRSRPPFNPALEALASALNKKTRVVFDPDSALMVNRAARMARELGLDFLIVSSGQEWRRPDLAKAAGVPFIVPVGYPELPKLPEDDDWNAVTLDQFRAWDWAPENPKLLRDQGIEIALTTYGLADKKNFRRNVKFALDRGLVEAEAIAALTTIPAKLCGVENLLGTIERGKLANLTVVDGKSYFDTDAKVREVWIDGRYHRVQLEPSKPKDAKAEEKKPENDEKEALKKRVARSPLEGRGPITNAASIVIRNATIWTSGPKGILTNATLAISGGKITSVGGKVEIGPNTFVIDAEGGHVTPGLIDCHSHAMILGGVNESTVPSSAMVRIADVVNSETDNIYEQLAGGLTVANLLHGSANPIGGQNAVIKLRDGDGPDELIFKDAPPGIKFALGENVKQANWGDRHTTRFPQSRMGVQTFIANRFIAAQQYMNKREQFKKSGGAPPVRDMELETIGEIVQGARWIHCHSYRQDEILAFLRLMESFGVRVGTLQHVLEGYKVADEIRRHGAGASCFADWWAYKFEVYDAIPHAGSLMHERGVLVSFNSDSPDLARRMYTEAAKAVKYGGTSEIDALKFITINPAKQLRIDHRVGSLEPGKDADFAIWSKSPLDSETRCEQTWIEGKQYFDIARTAERVEALRAEKQALIEKAKKILKAGGGEKPDAAGEKKFFQVALEHMHDHEERHCDDD